MVLILELLLIFCILCLLHTYLFYPFSLALLTQNKKNNTLCFQPNDFDLPYVCVLMSVFNEAHVIQSKLKSLITTDYPTEKILFFVGSDASTDATDEILKVFQEKNSNFYFFQFDTRRGKPSVVNDLVKLSALHQCKNNSPTIFILTDASVILMPATIFNLVKHFKNPTIALVDSHQIAKTLDGKESIAEAEKNYIGREVVLKHSEGLLDFNMLGPLGGCYALRSDFFTEIPIKNLVDDFYLAMRVLEKNGGAINDLDAVCYEPLPSSIAVEYRRKRRISTGNFQNLKTFSHLLWQLNMRAYIFWSHKILRWFGPFFLLGIIFCTIGLNLCSEKIEFCFLLIIEIIGLIVLPTIDYLLSKMGFTSKYLRAWRYLIIMNIALFHGFLNYTKGVKSGIWQPTPREGKF